MKAKLFQSFLFESISELPSILDIDEDDEVPEERALSEDEEEGPAGKVELMKFFLVPGCKICFLLFDHAWVRFGLSPTC